MAERGGVVAGARVSGRWSEEDMRRKAGEWSARRGGVVVGAPTKTVSRGTGTARDQRSVTRGTSHSNRARELFSWGPLRRLLATAPVSPDTLAVDGASVYKGTFPDEAFEKNSTPRKPKYGAQMAIDRRLVAKGKSEPFQALVDQARYHLVLAEEHGAALAEYNWTAEQTSALAADILALDTEKSRQLDERSSAKSLSRDEAAAISEAKNLINKIRNVARQVVRKHSQVGVTVEDFNAGGPLGRAAGRVSEYLGRVRVSAAKLDEAFAPYFKQQLLTKLIDEARTRLDSANASQEVDVASLPEDTSVVYERKGRVLEHIEDMNAIARNAFSDAPEKRTMFNKDILNRSRRTKTSADSPAPTPPTS